MSVPELRGQRSLSSPPPEVPAAATHLRRRLIALPLLVAALPLASLAQAGPPLPTAIIVDVEREGDRFRVTARADLAADARTAWDTLTDYERLPEFVPGVTRSRVLAREERASGERLKVEYSGTFKLLFIALPTRVRLDVQHVPFTDVLAQSSTDATRSGQPAPTLKSFSGRYTLVVVGAPRAGRPRVRLDYSAQFELAEPLPPVIGTLFGTSAVRHAMREQFGAMVAEIERRSRGRPSIQKAG